MRHGRKLVLGLTAAILLASGVSEAGIVVLDNGDVFLGKIRESEVSQDKLVLREPNGEQGKMDIPMFRVRWFDAEADTLTHEYFAEHAKEKLHGARWQKLRDEWARPREPVELDPGIWVGVGKPRLDSFEDFGEGFSIRKPAGWTASLQQGILILKAPSKGPNGFTPRIHVFAVSAASASPDAQLEWIHKELENLSGPGDQFQILEMNRRQTLAQGANQRLLTETRTSKRSVLALRQVCFRSGQTYLFSAYADSREFEWLQPLFTASLETLHLSEDRQP